MTRRLNYDPERLYKSVEFHVGLLGPSELSAVRARAAISTIEFASEWFVRTKGARESDKSSQMEEWLFLGIQTLFETRSSIATHIPLEQLRDTAMRLMGASPYLAEELLEGAKWISSAAFEIDLDEE